MKSRWEGKRLLFIESGQKLYFRGYQLFQLGVLGDCGTASAVKRGRPKGEAQRPRAQEMKHKIKQRLYLCTKVIVVTFCATTHENKKLFVFRVENQSLLIFMLHFSSEM